MQAPREFGVWTVDEPGKDDHHEADHFGDGHRGRERRRLHDTPRGYASHDQDESNRDHTAWQWREHVDISGAATCDRGRRHDGNQCNRQADANSERF